MKLSKNNILILLSGFSFITLSILLSLFLQLEIVILGIVILVFLILLKYVNYSKNVLLAEIKEIREEVDQNEALFNIQNHINPRLPLPSMTGWAVYPDFVNVIIKYILVKKPKTIVELGSGVSTIIISYLIEQNDMDCDFISLEEDEDYLQKTKQELSAHNLGKYVDLIYTPLKQYKLDNKFYRWYDLSGLQLTNIDYLVIDGPSTASDPESRYPAIPLLSNKLNKGAVILLDDASRPGEKSITQKWVDQNPDLVINFIKTKKGTAVLMKNS